MQSCLPIVEPMLISVFFPYVLFNFCNKNNSYFYLALIHLPKFKGGQGQTSVILLVS